MQKNFDKNYKNIYYSITVYLYDKAGQILGNIVF